MPPDAIVVGSGPNGLAAGIELARAGLRVQLIEAAGTIGGGLRTRALTLPGFLHDVCSAVHPLAADSPCLRGWPLEAHGLEWITPPAAAAHPLDAGAVMLEHDLERTAAALGPDAAHWRELFAPHLRAWEQLKPELLAPLHWPRHLLALARFGLTGLRSASGLALSHFETESARALLAGIAAHAIQPLETPGSAAIALVLALAAFGRGWPLPRGGAQSLADALAAYFNSLGGEIITGTPIKSLNEIRQARAVLLSITPRQLLRLAGDELPARYRRSLEAFRYGPGVFKLDWALAAPIPWRDPACLRAATVHVGGTLDEIRASEHAAFHGTLCERPYVMVTQPSLFDPTRAPASRHTAWGYCHVPHGCTADMTARIEAQLERFAPGFRDVILARHTLSPAALERYNENYIGGDINGGVQDLRQLFHRPVHALHPYRVPLPGVYLCSSSTPPGGGVHGMPGHHAARLALREVFGITSTQSIS